VHPNTSAALGVLSGCEARAARVVTVAAERSSIAMSAFFKLENVRTR